MLPPQKCLIVKPFNDDDPKDGGKFSASCAGLTRASINLRKSSGEGKMDCRVKPGKSAEAPPLLKFRRRRAVEDVPFGAVKQIERIGFDDERSALARELRDALDPRERCLQLGISVGPHLVDI